MDFVTRFRVMGLDERQTSIFAALVMCQPESGITTTTHMQPATLVKMLQVSIREVGFKVRLKLMVD